MKIIISPAKNFKKIDNIKVEEIIYKKESEKLVSFFKEKTMAEIGNIFKLNDNLTEKVYYDYKEFDFDKLDSPAIFTYDGLVYKQFCLKDFDDLDYLNNHVYIISAIFGPLKPLTGIRPYRLDMMIKEIDMYNFWKDKIYKEVFKENDLVLNLASKEYSKLLTDYMEDDKKIITINFKDLKNGKLKTVVSWTKTMRGKMLKEIISKKIEDIEEIKKLKIDNYIYEKSLSNDYELTFVRRNR